MRSFINVMDLEATCYETEAEWPEGEEKEVIEIGLTVVDLDTLSIKKTVSIPVWPRLSQISPFCTKLTGWTMEKLERQRAISLEAACARLTGQKYGSKNRLLVTDSEGDADLIEHQCRTLGLDSPLGPYRQNVATLFKLLTGETENIGLEKMLARVGLQFEGPRHRGWSDSNNQARLFIELLKRTTLRQYKTDRQQPSS
jgi:inhibitor of KinA sporulation pathway (predicted exonuclease)